MNLILSKRNMSVLALFGMVIHVGTALLRLNTFWPYPKLLDFGSFYAGAWALRQGISPYKLSSPLQQRLAAETGLPLSLPPLNSFPLWPWLLQPLSWLPFPLAAWVWVLLNLGFLAWCTKKLGEIAGVSPGPQRVLFFTLVLTFGPVTLSLTLGQTGILLLVLALAVGRRFESAVRTSLIRQITTGILWLCAWATKPFSLLWLPGLVFLRRWRPLSWALGAIPALGLLHIVLLPRITWYYFTEFLPAQTMRLSTGTLDDQSLVAWALRITQPMHIQTPGMSVFRRHWIVWSPPVLVAPSVIRGACLALLTLAGVSLAWSLWHQNSKQPEPLFYIWVLFSLLVLPHTERYNHTLLLPAMAWLWTQGEEGRHIVAIVYFLAGMARLTHLWVLILPWPWGPLATGFGVVAVLILIVSMAGRLSVKP